MDRVEKLEKMVEDLVEEINHYTFVYIKTMAPSSRAIIGDNICYLRTKRTAIENMLLKEIYERT